MNPLADFMPRMQAAIAQCNAEGYDRASIIWNENRLDDIPIHLWGPMIFSAPVMDHYECDDLLAYADTNRGAFEVNPEEETPYQVEELVLRYKAPALFPKFINMLDQRITPLFQIMTGHTPGKASSIQLARYTTDATAQSDWHVDEQSELSCVVSLAPDRHSGGGTYLRPYGPAGQTIFVPALPKGHALFFNGRFVHHRGAEVRAGERMLLVFWLMGDANKGGYPVV